MLRRLLHYVGPVLAVALLGLALWVLHRMLEGHSYADVMARVRSLPAWRVGAAVALTCVAYGVLTLYDDMAVHSVGFPLSYRRTAITSFIAYAFGHSLGFAAITAGGIRLRFYTGWGMTAADVVRVTVFVSVTFFVGLCAVGTVAFAVDPLAVPHFMHLPVLTVRPLALVLATMMAAYLYWTLVSRRTLSIRGFTLVPPTPRTVAGQIAVSSADWLLAASVFWVLLPGHASFGVVTCAFVLAVMAGFISHVPGGVGVFEAVALALLSDVAPNDTLLAVLLVYRLTYYGLPLVLSALLLGGYELFVRRGEGGAKKTLKKALAVPAGAATFVPQAAASLSFLAGVVLLASGATPGVPHRIHALGRFLPTAVVEGSHFAASIVGAGLIILAAGLRRRVDVAWGLAVALLAAGVVLSLLKGLDWEEAVVLGVVLAVVAACRREFHRRAEVLGPMSPVWLLSTLAAAAVVTWLAVFGHKHKDVDLLDFALHAEAPRAIRATVAGGAVLAVVLAYRLLRPFTRGGRSESTADLADAERIVAASPQTTAQLALVGDKRFVFTPDRDGLVMYACAGGTWAAMGDPLGARPQDAAWAFRDAAETAGARWCFYEVRHDALAVYADLGCALLKLGEEAVVPLAGFDLAGPARRDLRKTVNKIDKAGGGFEVVPAADVPALLPALRGVSDGWLAAKEAKELGFSLGYFDEAYLQRNPVAVVRQGGGGGEVVAFANLWTGGDGRELSVDLMRHAPAAPGGTMDYLFARLMLWGREHGYARFNLGMAPLAGMERAAMRRGGPLWPKLGGLLYRHGERLYGFQGLRQWKAKYGPEWQPRYLALRHPWQAPAVLADVARLVRRRPHQGVE